MKVIFTCTTGREVRNDGTAKANVFWAPRPMQDGKEQMLSMAAKQGLGEIRKLSSDPQIPAVRGCDPNLIGSWQKSTYEMPEGTILKLFGFIDQGFQTRKRSASQFIKIREGAALRRVRIQLLARPDSGLSFVEFTGKFDLLPLETALGLIGYDIADNYRSFFDPALVERTMQIVELERERVAERVIEPVAASNPETGETVKFFMPRRERKIDL